MKIHQLTTPARGFSLLSAVWVAAVFWASSGPIQWGDNGQFLGLAGTQGLFVHDLSELSHPFYHLVSVGVARWAGQMGVAYFNAALMLPLGLLSYALSRRLGATEGISAAAAAAVLSTHAVLWVATKVEVYLLHLVLVMGCWWLYSARPDAGRASWRRLLAVGALGGLALCVHQLTLIVLAPLVALLLIEQRERSGWVLAGGLLGLFSCVPAYWAHSEAGQSLWAIAHRYLTGAGAVHQDGWESLFFRWDLLGARRHLVASVLVSLMGFGAYGISRLPRSALGRAAWVSVVLNLAFAITYDVPDRFTFFLPGAALAIVLGAQRLGARPGDQQGARPWVWPAVLSVGPVLVLHGVPLLASAWLMTLPRVQSPAPGLNPLTYYFSPLRPDHSAAQFADAMAQVVPPGGTVYADHMTRHALASAQLVGKFQGREVLPCQAFVPGAHPGPVFLPQALGCDLAMRYVHKALPMGYLLAPAGPPH